ncbi:unnamed protein product [Paramecium pentaurelia]|uniref:Uncharacterized protein n=1 Tax=Paramecium pentaurelia TaxID=43138 RepID=A0A8S1UZU5_9CILI|nr:unnamed protein product [Paramecium pentaurelia]
MMINTIFKKVIMSEPFSRWLNEQYWTLKLSIDINFIIYLIPNISTINQQSQIIMKKFINQLLISQMRKEKQIEISMRN